MENRLIEYMKKVGVGSHGSKHLTHQEAYEAMRAILDGGYHPVTLGSFLIALRMKGETGDELAGFADALLEDVDRVNEQTPIPHLLNSGGAFNGKDHTLNINIPASILAVAAGAKILLQGSEGVPAKMGMTAYHVLNQLGIRTDKTPQEAWNDIQTIGIAYLHQPLIHPKLFELTNKRRQLGKRSFLNTIEPMMNPLHARCHLGGFFHRPYAELSCEAIARSKLGFERAVFVSSIEGSDELRPTRSMVAEWQNHSVQTYYIDPYDFGLNPKFDDIESKTTSIDELAAQSAQHILGLVDGHIPPGYRDLVLYNAAFRLYVSGTAESIAEGLDKAQAVLPETISNLFQHWKES